MGAATQVNELDWMGAEGGRLAAAFATGCVACWTFLQGFFWRGIRKSYEARIKLLEEHNDQCNQRQLQLETMLWMHGPQQLRQQMQSVVSEAHIEMRAALAAGQVVTGEER
jgi:hypothetical protein